MSIRDKWRMFLAGAAGSLGTAAAGILGAAAVGIPGAAAVGSLGTAAAGILGAAAASLLGAAPAAAQEIPVDRWLMASGVVEAGAEPLPAMAADRFPDRNLEVESRAWTLVRRDGERRFDVAEWTVAGEATLAHAYLRATTDANVRLALSVEACVDLRVWLNGQALADPGRPREVRLASGWNTLLIVLDGEPGCDRSLSAALSRERRAPTRGASIPSPR